MDFFVRNLADGGILLFSYAGEYVRDLIADGETQFLKAEEVPTALESFDHTGFGFVNYEGAVRDYGRSIASRAWVERFMHSYPQLRLVLHFERGWGVRQNVVGCVLEPEFATTRLKPPLLSSAKG